MTKRQTGPGSLWVAVGLLLLPGCERQPPPRPVATPPVPNAAKPDDSKSAFEAAGKVTMNDRGELTSIDLRGEPYDEALFASVNEHPSLKAIRLGGGGDGVDAELTSDSFARIAQLPRLKVLAIDAVRVVGDQVAKLSLPPTLVEFYASGTNLPGGVLQQLDQLPLRKLRLSGIELGTETKRAISRCGTLIELDLSSTTNLDASFIQDLPTKLHKLNLYDTAIGDEAIKSIAKLPDLVELNLDKTEITDRGVTDLVSLKGLKWLHLGSTSVSDAAAESLASIDTLKTLIVTRTRMTTEGVKAIRRQLPELDIELEYRGGSNDR